MNSRPTKRKRPVARPSANKRQRPQGGALMRIERMDHPPQISGYEIAHFKRLRFTATAAANATVITFENLLDTCLMAVTAILGYELFDLVRIVQVEAWGQAALGTPSTITILYSTPAGDQSVHTDTSLGVKPAYVRAVPSDRSLASLWQIVTAGNAFLITCPAGSVIDVTLELKTTEAAATVALNALVGATIGEIYFRGLDGLAIAGTNFPPVAGVARI
jgi:hypothetical protein